MGVGPAFVHCKTGSPIEVDNQTIAYWDMCLPFTYIASVLGLPSLILPLGQSKNGLPIGVQIIGAPHSEKELLHFGKLLEPYIQGYKPPHRFSSPTSNHRHELI